MSQSPGESPVRRFAGPLVLALITVAVFWKILLTDQYTWINSPDFAYQVVPWFQFQAVQWHQGHFALWDPRHVAGQSLVGQMQPGVMYPLNWLLFALPLNNGFIRMSTLHWYYAAIHFLAALFAYALARDLKRSRIASILAGVAFAFGGFVGTNGWPQMLNGAIWAPLVMLFSLRAFRGQRLYLNAALAGLCLGMAYLSGHHQAPTYIMLAASALWMIQIGRFALVAQRREALACLAGFAILAAIAFSVSAPQTLPAYSYAQDSVRWVGLDHPVGWKEKVPYQIFDTFSLPPHALLGIFIPEIAINSDPYLGLIVFVLAISAIGLAWREAAVKMMAGMSLLGILLAITGSTLVHGLIYALVPTVDKARNPSMAIVLLSAGAAVLAAYGLDFLLEDAATNWRKRLAACVGIFSALGWIFIAAVTMIKLTPTLYTDRLATALVITTIGAGVLWGTRSAPALLILALLELGTLPSMNWASRTEGQPIADSLRRDPDVAAFLRAQPAPVRTDVKEDDVPYNFGDWYGIDTFDGGYFASLPTRLLNSMWDDRARAIYGVNYSIAKAAPKPGMQELFSSAAGIKVFAVPGAMPRVWSVHQADSIPTDEHTGAALQSHDPRQSTFVTGAAPALETCADDNVRLLSATVHKIVIRATMNCRGIVIHGDAWEKNWTARVDGNDTKLYAAFGIVRGVVVDRGEHTVELRYRPKAVYWGAALCAAAMLSIAALAVFV